jgi:hypothetical protein
MVRVVLLKFTKGIDGICHANEAQNNLYTLT